MDDKGGSCDLIWCSDDVLAPVSPAESKTESRIAEASSITSETGRVRDPGSHFTERSHDDVDKETDRRVGDENRGRSVAG